MKFLGIRDLRTKSAVVKTTQNLSFEKDAPFVPPHALVAVLMNKSFDQIDEYIGTVHGKQITQHPAARDVAISRHPITARSGNASDGIGEACK